MRLLDQSSEGAGATPLLGQVYCREVACIDLCRHFQIRIGSSGSRCGIQLLQGRLYQHECLSWLVKELLLDNVAVLDVFRYQAVGKRFTKLITHGYDYYVDEDEP